MNDDILVYMYIPKNMKNLQCLFKYTWYIGSIFVTKYDYWQIFFKFSEISRGRKCMTLQETQENSKQVNNKIIYFVLTCVALQIQFTRQNMSTDRLNRFGRIKSNCMRPNMNMEPNMQICRIKHVFELDQYSLQSDHI